MVVDPNSNDNERAFDKSDEPGMAALLLVESLIHSLIARSVISVEDAIEIVTTATEVKDAMEDDGPVSVQNRHTLLASISASLSFDDPRM